MENPNELNIPPDMNEELMPTEQDEISQQLITTVNNLERLRDLTKTELVLLKDDKMGLVVELHSSKLDVENLTELAARGFAFLKNKRQEEAQQKSLPTGVE